MKVLVTGATGLLGANVVEQLASQGHTVHVLIRRTSNLSGLQGLEYQPFYGNVEDLDSIVLAAKGCHALIHCAANTKQWNTSLKEHLQINLDGTKTIVKACEMAEVGKLVFISTANTFPLLNQEPFPLDTHYVFSKKIAEDYVLAQHQLPAVVINPSFMIGARDSKPSSGQSVLHYLNHNPVLTPAGGKSFIHVRDVADAILKVLDPQYQKGRFLLANENRSYHSFFKLIGEVTDTKRIILKLPPFLMNIAGAVGTLYGNLVRNHPKLNQENALLINTHLYYDGEPAYRELGIKKRPLEEAVYDAVDWFQKNGYC